MQLPLSCRAGLSGLGLLAMFAAPLAAQNLLLTEYKGRLLPVVKAYDTRPFVEVDGKKVSAPGMRFALHPVEEYLPAYVSVRDLDVSTSAVEVDTTAMNHEFALRARLETSYRLDDVFIVLDLDTESAGKLLFLQEVGDLKPRTSKSVSVRVMLSAALGSGHYQLHLFSRGAEILHTEIDPMHRESVLDRMTLKRIASVQDAPPRLFFGPQPEYPPKLWKAKTSGDAVISVRIGANGRLSEETVKSASDPAFGEAALDAVRMWRFLPRVKNGVPIDSHADLPLKFAPPEAGH